MRSFGTYFVPGPTEVRPEVRVAMTRPMISHRSAAFTAMYGRIQEGLRTVFGMRRPAYVSTSSASGLMEAAIRCAPAGPVLALVNGAFSARFANIARACDREVRVLEVPPGAVHTVAEVEAMLASYWFAAITIGHMGDHTPEGVARCLDA